MESCNGMALKKNTMEKSTDLKENFEPKFNKTVQTKTFLVDAMVFSINKTADALLATKQHFKKAKDALTTKISTTANKTAHKLEEIKEEIHNHQRAKTAANQPGQIVYVTRNFLVTPMVNEVPTVPMLSYGVPTNYVPTDISNPFAWNVSF